MKVNKEEKVNPFKRVSNGGSYYSIGGYGGGVVECIEYSTTDYDDKLYNIANYCTDKTIIEQRAKEEILNRKLWRFSMENGGDKIDWNDIGQYKYFIDIDNRADVIFCRSIRYCIALNTVHFISKEVCNEAIELFGDEIREVYDIK